MNCVECERPSHGVCKFCGRAICKDHFKHENYIIDIHSLNKESIGKVKVLIVENALFCGICRPIGELIEVDLSSK